MVSEFREVRCAATGSVVAEVRSLARKRELEGMFNVIYPTEFGLLQISFPPNPSISRVEGGSRNG
jgi:hypothetical protein